MVKNCVDKFADIKKDTKIYVDVPNIRVLTDINGFEKTIDNLISNAIKYNLTENPIVEIKYKDNIPRD